MVVPHGSLPPDSVQIGGKTLNGGALAKRKTPSELREQQLKQVNVMEPVVESSSPQLGFTKEVENVSKRPELLRIPRYIDTHVDELFPAKKSRFRTISAKENCKKNTSMEQKSNLKSLPPLSNFAFKRQREISCQEDSVADAEVARDSLSQFSQKYEKCSKSNFRTVTQISLAGDKSSGLAPIDMDKALRGLTALELHHGSGVAADLSERSYNPSTLTGNPLSECHVSGAKAPLDLTLKTTLRLTSSSSVNWIHRLVLSSTMSPFAFQFNKKHMEEQNTSPDSQSQSSSQVFGSKVLNSWIYPQSVLPPSVISVLRSSAAGGAELEFLSKRQAAWEESFRNIYYMLRNNLCGIFYVCTSLFVVMFTSRDGSGKSKCSCNAYISRSTRGLRSLLQEHDVSFSMPLCHSKEEQVNTEDLVELSEIEKHNLGQTRRFNSFSDVDNSPESLLAFSGNKSVHSLYDFLLNYRSFLTSLSAADVPLLCSPMPFLNAALSSPEIKCMEMKTVEHIAGSSNGIIGNEDESTGRRCTVEVKDAYLPPWIVCGICAIMGSDGRTFEASFVTEPTSIGLNVALEEICDKPKSQEKPEGSSKKCSHAYGIPDATVNCCLRSCTLKGLKYCNGSYTASLSHV